MPVWKRIVCPFAALALGLSLSLGAQATSPHGTVESQQSFQATVEAVREGIEQRGLTLFQEVDHRANAEAVGQSLPPTHLFIFGKPEVGSQLMRCAPTLALDLPQKMLVLETEGQVRVLWNRQGALFEKHGNEPGPCAGLTGKVNGLLKGLAQEASAAP